LEQLEPESSVYNICRASRLLGTLNITALETSLSEIILRHEILRTAFRSVDGQPLQIVQPAQNISINSGDLQSSPETERDVEVKRRIAAEAQRPFDLSEGLFLRCNLLRVRDEEQVLILTTHHIVSDAWSMGILFRELWTLYETFSNGKPSPFERLPVQYSDYAVWQRKWLQGEVLESQLSYWKHLLDSSPPMLNLPTDRPRPARQSFCGASMPVALSESLTEAINELSRREGVTQYMTLLAAFNVLLYRYSNQEDILVGSPIAHRHHAEVESLIGYFVNTFVLRIDLSGKPTFRELLHRVRDVCIGAYTYQELPFEKLVGELQPERDLSRNPLFQVMFILQNAPRPEADVSTINLQSYNVDTATSKFDLTLSLREREGKLVGFFEYSTDLFDCSTIERMAGHFQTLLSGIVADPDQRISKLPLLNEADRHQLLVEWNDTDADYTKDKCIHELFEEQAEQTPNAIAVTFEGRRLTYRELNTKANQLAHHLQGLGVGPETLVGICVERSLEMVVGLLGILKSGGAYVPLDPTYPKERLAIMLEDAQVSVVITQDRLIERAQQSTVTNQPLNICFDRDWNTIEEQPGDNLQNKASSTNLAYVIYTSGSTGKPKGVQINHRSVINLLHSTQPLFQFNESDVWTGFHSCAFDFSVWEIWGCLLSGGRLLVIPVELTRSPEGFWAFLYEEKVTVLNQTPSALRHLLAENSKFASFPGNMSLRLIICGGDALPGELASSILKWGIPLWNFYGPTEATVWATIHEIKSIDVRKPSIPIGRPLANIKTYILDSQLQVVPVSVPGELCLGGIGLARGYFNDADLTALKFIPSPFGGESISRLYRTGDLARYLPDGNIEFLGRVDNQVKIRGYRIELGEIEVALNQHPGVRESVVLVYNGVLGHGSDGENTKSRIENPKLDQRLVAYVVPEQPSPPSGSELRSFLRDKLPEYMIPSTFVILDELSLTPSGKVDRKALPPPDNTRRFLEDEYLEPRTQVEEIVAQIWKEILELDTVGVHDNFFDLGGHSLLAIQIISRVRETFDKNVPLVAIFEMPTIAGLASTVEKAINGGSCDLPSIVPLPRDGPLPLSIAQEQLWQLDEMLPGTHFFNVPFVYRLSGPLDIAGLEKSLSETIGRHEILRTVYPKVDGLPVGLIKEVSNFELQVTDLRDRASDDLVQATTDLILEARKHPFNLRQGPLIQIQLLRLADEESLLLVTSHHIIIDQWSMRVLRSELVTLYKAFSRGAPSPLPDPPIQFGDFARWERDSMDSDFLKVQLDYWKKQLADPLPVLEFTGMENPKNQISFRISRCPIELDVDLFSGINTLARNERCTSFMVLLVALSAALFEHTGRTDIRIGTLVANRRRKETELTVGNFVNTVILRIRVSGRMTFRQLLAQARDVTLAAFAHQELPFEQLARTLERERGVDRASLFQVLLIYQHMTDLPVSLPGLTFAPVPMHRLGTDSDIAITAFDLIFDLRESSTKLNGSLTYKTEGFRVAEVAGITKSVIEILRRMVSRPQQPLSSSSA
jgi:amino acid adenylation domain-containing protein